jgi:hypothetical protein
MSRHDHTQPDLRSYGRRRGRAPSRRQAALWRDVLPRVAVVKAPGARVRWPQCGGAPVRVLPNVKRNTYDRDDAGRARWRSGRPRERRCAIDLCHAECRAGTAKKCQEPTLIER